MHVVRSCIWVHWLVLFFVADLSKSGALSFTSFAIRHLAGQVFVPCLHVLKRGNAGRSSVVQIGCALTRVRRTCMYLNMVK